MNVLRITKGKFCELQILRRQLQDPKDAILCMCERCDGFGFAQDESLIDKRGYLRGMICPCGGRNKRVDKVEIII